MNRPPRQPSALTITQTFDGDIAVDHADAGRAVYRADPTAPKPCVHPIVTAAGHALTGFQMSDHLWHRGLWFTIKFINGTNYWEENAPFGVQSAASQPRVELTSSSEATLTQRLDWTSEATGSVVRESRTLVFRELSDGVQAIDWTSSLEGMSDLLLDRTPYTTWGGYSGLTFRAQRGFHKASFLVPGGETVPQLLGDRHDWVVLQGQLDGGPDEHVAVGMIDHPSNPRGQTPWYGKSADNYVFFNAAFLFHEPMNVRKGETLTFRYRTLFRDGSWSADAFAGIASEFRAT